MVSDYTISYGMEALEPQQLVRNSEGRFVPSYVALDRKVLRFHAWFRDPRGAVGFKVRKATLFHYLEDGSTRISEKRVENSGIVTGEIARRHRVPKPGGGSTDIYTVEDFDVGAVIEVFGRGYTIVDMDEFTREFFALNGMQRKEPIGMPDDYVEPVARGPPPMIHSYPDVIFQTQGVSDRFLNLDRKVLRFYCSWGDQRPYGEEKQFVLNYFLVDDTVEILEVHTRNDGRDPWNSLLKRRPLLKGLPRQVIETEEDRKKNPQARWHWSELSIGTVIQVYHRDFLIRDCDQYTRDWMDKHGLHQPEAIPPESKEQQEFLRKVPKYLGWGTPEDSMQTVINPIAPKPKNADFVKALANGGKVMRFSARLLATPDDAGREFVLSFFLANDHISIFEKPTRNTFTGLRADGAKFLEKGPVEHPDSDRSTIPRYYTLDDVQHWTEGTRVMINGYEFEIAGSDEYTAALQSGEAPKLDMHKSLILSQIKAEMRKIAIKPADQFEYVDRKDDGVISADELDTTLKNLGIRISEAEVHEFIDLFDQDGDGALDFEEFKGMLSVL